MSVNPTGSPITNAAPTEIIEAAAAAPTEQTSQQEASEAPIHDHAEAAAQQSKKLASFGFAGSLMAAILKGKLSLASEQAAPSNQPAPSNQAPPSNQAAPSNQAPPSDEAAAPGPDPALDRARSGKATIRKGANGPEVAALQKALNAAGADPPLEVDGIFKSRTLAAVKRFQRSHGCSADGIVGKKTMVVLDKTTKVSQSAETGASEPIPGPPTDNRTPPPTKSGPPAGAKALANRNASSDDQFQHYKTMIEANGGSVDATPGQRTVLALRGVAPDGKVTDEATRKVKAYNDTFVVLWRDKQGKAHVEHFRGSTTPSRKKTNYRETPDVNRDGKKDIAHLEPGTYKFRKRSYKGKSAYGGKGRVRVTRDTNHDGKISEEERAESKKRGDRAGGILFHRGGRKGPRSVGCQTLSPKEFNAFEKALGRDRKWSYTLVDPR